MLTKLLPRFKTSPIGHRSFSFWSKAIQQPKELQILLDQIKEEKRVVGKQLSTETNFISPVSHHETICVLLHELIHRAETMNDTPLMNDLNQLKRTPYRGVFGLEYPFKNISLDDYKGMLQKECQLKRIGREDDHGAFTFGEYLLYILAFPAKFRYNRSLHYNSSSILYGGYQCPDPTFDGFNAYGELDLSAWDAKHSPPHSGLKTASVILDHYALTERDHSSSEQCDKNLIEYCTKDIDLKHII